MVHVEITAEGAETTCAKAVEGWANAHPGDEQMIVQVGSSNPFVAWPPPSVWPNGVDGDIDALADLAAAVGDHAITYTIELRGEDGQGIHGHARHAGHGGHRYIEEKPGVFTSSQVRGFLFAPQFSWVALVASGVVAILLTRLFDRIFG